ncbi:hypothetical protein LEP1GSC079_4620 [Leptospira interrogans str. FPW1039]|uniref:Uncharacterized protein n=1 Tax=Leptospira interrogans str. FPW1039 TaxID=1193040 RepID=A0A0F6IBP7_LEPIR|nr:hypothetical protein LEP1GSC079_4620 [Leptospira interrogans str. FPW1039]
MHERNVIQYSSFVLIDYRARFGKLRECLSKDQHSGGVLLSSRNETLSLKERFAGSFASIFFTFTGEGEPT